MSASHQPPPSDTWYKNQLQEYAQKAAIALPVYKSVCAGQLHAPQYRAHVWIDGRSYTTPETFPSRRNAEQEAAKIALLGIQETIKKEGSDRVLADTVFGKQIIYEYAVKMNLGAPTYETKESKAVVAIFVSTLFLNGVSYIGDAGRNKKEAEQLAARSAILSILDTESGSTMSEIVRSKFKLYDAFKNGKDSVNVEEDKLPAAANALEDSGTHLSGHKRKEPCGNEMTSIAQIGPALRSSPLEQLPNIQSPLSLSTVQQNPGDQAVLVSAIEPVTQLPLDQHPNIQSPLSLSTLQQNPGDQAAQVSDIQPIAQLPLEQHLNIQSPLSLSTLQQNPGDQAAQVLAMQLPLEQQSLDQGASQQPIAQSSLVQEPINEFKRLKPVSEPENLPTEFVLPTSEQAPGSSPAARKRQRKKERKRAQLLASLRNAAAPNQPPVDGSSSI